MKRISMLVILLILCLSTGCEKVQDKNQLVAEDSATAANSNTQNSTGTAGKPAAEDSESDLVKLPDGTTLDYKEPVLHAQILAVLPNNEKSNYVVVTDCQAPYSNSWTQLQFFKADGTFLHSTQTMGCFLTGWKDEQVTFDGDSFRLNGGSFQFYYDIKSSLSLKVDGNLLCSDGGVNLIFEANSGICTLVQDNKMIDSMEVTLDDLDFTTNEEPEPRQYRLDAKKKIATIETKHIRFTLDFNTKTVSTERFYTNEDLCELVGTSADGTAEVYTSIGGGAGDGFWRQVVTYNKTSGKITFLTYLNDWEYAVIGPDDTLICNRFSSLELMNIKTLKKVDNFFDFPFWTQEKSGYFLRGLTYDKEKEQFILAYSDSKEDDEGIAKLQAELEAKKDPNPGIAGLIYKPRIHVMVLNRQGKQIKKINTDLRIYPYVDGCGARNVKIAKNKDGSYTLDGWDGEDKTTIKP